MIKLNQNECIGCGLCASICPETFMMNEDYKAEVLADDNQACAQKAANNCPVKAITIS